MDWPSATVEKGDWEVYQASVMVADGAPVLEDDLFLAYTEYMQRGPLPYDGWLNGSM